MGGWWGDSRFVMFLDVLGCMCVILVGLVGVCEDVWSFCCGWDCGLECFCVLGMFCRCLFLLCVGCVFVFCIYCLLFLLIGCGGECFGCVKGCEFLCLEEGEVVIRYL